MALRRKAGCLAVLSLLVAGGIGCGGGGGGGGEPPAPTTVTQVVTSSGAQVPLPGGGALDIPSGALVSSATITVTAAASAPTGSGYGGVGKLYVFGPDGQAFATPVTVKLPVPAGTATASIWWSQPGGGYASIGGTRSGGFISATVDHFSSGFVGAACTEGAACQPGGNLCQQGTQTCTGGVLCGLTGNEPDGTQCPDAAHACLGGNCIVACVDGSACTPATPDPCKTYANSCDATHTVFTCGVAGDQPEGHTCPDGVCSAGQCVAACVPAQTCSGADPCRSYAFQCNGTLTGGTCVAGAALAEGTSCGQGLVCDASAKCVAACVPGVTCTPAGQPSACQDYATACNAALTVTTCAGSAKPNQTVCAPANACQAASACQAGVCVAGAPSACDDGNPCTTDQCALPGGCTHQVAANGTACPGGVCSGGQCSACAAGSACAMADPCRLGQVACGSGSPVCGDAGAKPDGTSCGGSLVCASGACACNAVPMGGAPTVTAVALAQAAPLATGGTILDGAYVVTAITFYTGPGGTSGPQTGTFAQAMRISGGVFQQVQVQGGGAPQRENGTYVAFGSQLVVNSTCGGSAPTNQSFTASGATLRAYNTTQIGIQETTLTRQGPTCIDAQACTPAATADPCKVYGLTCDASHTSGTCGVVADAPDGTTCGAGQACSAGACVGSTTRTVSGTWPTTYWLDDGARIDVDEPVDPGASVAAIVGTGAGATRLAGTLLPNGTFSIPAVPFGAYVLELVLPGFPALYVDETASDLDLGVDWLGRPDAALATATSQVTFNLSGLTPWATGDGFIVTAPNVATRSAAALGPVGAPSIAASATAGAFGYESRTVGINFGFGMIDTASGDDLWVHQMVAATATPATGGSLGYLRAGPAAHLTSGLTVVDGVGASVGTAQAPLALQAPPLTRSAPLNFAGSQFATYGPDTNPLATRSATERVWVMAAPHGVARPAPQNGGVLPLRVPLLQIDLSSATFGSSDTDFGTLSYGGGFLGGFTEWRVAERNVAVSFVAPGATSGFAITGGLGRADVMPAPNPVVPIISPPRLPLVDGQDARTFQGDIGLTPTLAWSAPTLGTPHHYAVQVWNLSVGAGGATTGAVVAQYRTSGTTFTVPPGVLQDGRTYVFHITAYQYAVDPGAALLTAPRRRGGLPAWGMAVTGLLRTCGAGGCQACVNGASCRPANACHVGALACANGFLCNDTLALAADGTACGSGLTCLGGQCGATRTVSGAFTTTYTPDSGVAVTTGTPQPAGTTVAAVVATGASATGYASRPGTLNADGTFSIPGVPGGPYYLEIVIGGVPNWFPFSTSTPSLAAVSYSRPDATKPAQSTLVDVSLTSLDPWTRTPAADQLFVASPQAAMDLAISPFGYGQPAVGGTSWAHTYDWQAFGGANGLPDAAKGDVVVAYQRAVTALPAGPGAAQVLRRAKKHAFLSGATGVTLADGAAGALAADLVDAPFTQTATLDARTTAFAALAPQVNPAATINASTGVFVGLNAVPHGAEFPADLGTRVRLAGWFLDGGAADAVYGPSSYGGFLDPALWKEWWGVSATYSVPVAAPGATPITFFALLASELTKAGDTLVAAPVLGPVTLPQVSGLDAFAPQSGVGVQPLLSWSPPALGAPTSTFISIYRLDNVAGATSMANVFFAVTRGSSFQVPPGILTGGGSYFATIQPFQAAWDVPDTSPYLYGATAHYATSVTGVFTP